MARLTKRFERRLAKQTYHYNKYTYFRKRRKPGDSVRARHHLRRFRANRRAVMKLVGLRRAKREEIRKWVAANVIPPASGEGPWDGTESVAREIEALVHKKRGNVTGSQKRTATFGNPGSDHHVSQTNAFAIDFLLANDYEMAYAIAAHFGVEWAGDYSNFYITRGGKRFRIQIIAGTHGTGPHLHVGIRRA